MIDSIEPQRKSSSSLQQQISSDGAYIKYKEKSAAELDQMVEYDMDEEVGYCKYYDLNLFKDYAWLELFNDRRKKAKQQIITETMFEFILDRLEKESHFQSVRDGNTTKSVIDQDAVCSVCLVSVTIIQKIS
jgi:hypothetical protein